MQVVLYDKAGIFSSPRVWWTFHAFGHEKCASCHKLLSSGSGVPEVAATHSF